MGQFDQAARAAADLEANYLLARDGTGETEGAFQTLVRPGTVPLPGGPERIADLVAIADDPEKPEAPWLLIHEIQTRHEERKPEVLLAETAIFACYAVDADRQEGPFLTLPVFVYLSGTCPRPVVDLRAPSGHGLVCAPVIWELEKDSALAELRKVDVGETSWDALFWTILMDGGGSDEALTLWLRLLNEKVPQKRRADVAYLALELAELTGGLPALERILGDVKMTESTVHNRTLALGEARGKLQVKRADLLTLLEARFSGEVPEEYLTIIRQQESYPLLEKWFSVAAYAKQAADLLAEMRK